LNNQSFSLITVETTNRKKLTEEFVRKNKYTFPVLFDDKKIAKKLYKIVGVPTTFIIDREGRIMFRHVGFKEGMEKVFVEEIEELLSSATE